MDDVFLVPNYLIYRAIRPWLPPAHPWAPPHLFTWKQWCAGSSPLNRWLGFGLTLSSWYMTAFLILVLRGAL